MGECLIIRGGGGTDTSNANATSAVVLTGYTCYVDDQLIVGSMPVQTLNQKLGAGGSVTIPAGYYDGVSSVISTSTLAEETAATAASSHILTGYTGWSNGGWIAGSMANWGNTGATLAANGVYWIPAGWHAGAGVVNQSLAVHGGGTYTPTTGDQVICWAGWYAAGNIVVLGSSNLAASNIRNGVSIFGVWGTCSGWIDSDLWVWDGTNYANNWGVCGIWGVAGDSKSSYGSIFAYSYTDLTQCRIAFFTNGQYNSLYFDWELTTGNNGYSYIWIYRCAGISDWSNVSVNGSTQIINLRLSADLSSAGNPWWNDDVLQGCNYVMFWLWAKNAYAGIKAIYFYDKIA